MSPALSRAINVVFVLCVCGVLFGAFGVLDHDIQIAHLVRVIGWIGMIATLGWMAWRSLQSHEADVIADRQPR